MDRIERNLKNRRFYVDSYYVPKLRELGYRESSRRYSDNDYVTVTKDNLIDVAFNLLIDLETSEGFTFCYVHLYIAKPNIRPPDHLIRFYHNRLRVNGDQFWYRREYLSLIELDVSRIDGIARDDSREISGIMDS